jgi:hypothetical protein
MNPLRKIQLIRRTIYLSSDDDGGESKAQEEFHFCEVFKERTAGTDKLHRFYIEGVYLFLEFKDYSPVM